MCCCGTCCRTLFCFSSPPYFSRPPWYSEAMSLDSSRKSTFHSCEVTMCGGVCTVVSMKLSRKPRLQMRFDLRQFWQFGRPSSHLRWRSLQVRHPVRTRFGLFAAADGSGAALPLASGTVMKPNWPCRPSYEDKDVLMLQSINIWRYCCSCCCLLFRFNNSEFPVPDAVLWVMQSRVD